MSLNSGVEDATPDDKNGGYKGEDSDVKPRKVRGMRGGMGSSRLVSNIAYDVDDPRRFGNKLRAAREAAGLSQVDLARMTGYSNGWISGVERGSSVPTSTFARRVERALGVDLKIAESVLAERQRRKKGDVGDWGMTPTEVAAYTGLSRTLIYDLLRSYTRVMAAAKAGTNNDKKIHDLDFLPWVDVDGFRRVEIKELARRLVETSWKEVVSTGGTTPSKEEVIKGEADYIKQWLVSHRPSV